MTWLSTVLDFLFKLFTYFIDKKVETSDEVTMLGGEDAKDTVNNSITDQLNS